jgi:ferredoxin--NADP+ reductase
MDTGLKSFLQKIKLKPVKVNSIEEIAASVYVLRFNRKHDFLAGQVLAISTNAEIPPRLYSICSGPDEAEIAILFSEKPEGLLTPRLADLKKGNELLVSAPFGAFLGDDKPAWWIASGTGIAPFRSMIRSGLGAKNMLIHGGRTLDSFYFSEELFPLLGDRYVRCCSQESAEGMYNGRLTQWLKDQQHIPSDLMFYLCGSAEMVVEVRDILVNKGIAIDQIMSEIYF